MLGGSARTMGLGSIKDFTLGEARNRARKARQLVSDGIDPIDLRDKERDQRRSEREDLKAEALARRTFQQCTDGYLASHAEHWRNAKHRAQWEGTLEKHVMPSIGDMPIDTIDRSHIVGIIEPLWHKTPDTARRIRQRIEAVFDWASARGFRTKPNPSTWEGHLKQLLPAVAKVKKPGHHEALPYAELPAFMIELRKRDGIAPRALELVVLTATRSGEAVYAKWNEIDLRNRIWTIPAERMKANDEHRVPLPDRAVAILESMPRVNDFVFPGTRSGQPLGKNAMLEVLQGSPVKVRLFTD
jgi:integrase